MCICTKLTGPLNQHYNHFRSDTDDQYANVTHFPNGSYPCNKTMPWDCLTTSTSAYIYMGFLVLMFLVGLIRAWSLYAVGVRSSKTLHDNLYQAVVRAPIRFHDTNPKGEWFAYNYECCRSCRHNIHFMMLK